MRLDSVISAFNRLAAVATPLAAALALAACASKPIASTTPAPVTTATQVSTSTTPTPATAMPQSGVASDLPAYLDPNSAISRQHSVWFAFDDSSYRAQDKATVELQGQFLAQHPDVHVTIAGNTDERGGSEYNLALGQRRAQSVKTALGLLGVKDAQVEATSYGKEKPLATGHNEAAWQQNRRADFVYPTK